MVLLASCEAAFNFYSPLLFVGPWVRGLDPFQNTCTVLPSCTPPSSLAPPPSFAVTCVHPLLSPCVVRSEVGAIGEEGLGW